MKLPMTEKRNSKSKNIDQLDTLEIVKLINSEDMLVAPAVGRESKKIAAAVDMIVERFKRNGRLFYVGAGTSGRLGVLDASECPPTFGVSPLLVQGIIAGGKRALVRAVEGAEDKIKDGIEQIKKRKITAKDVVVGIAACGLTPFVRAALKEAKKRKAGTIFITCAGAIKDIPAEIVINPVVGPEIITGSTRMKAGTATKLVLNLLTTTAMIKMGKVYGNLMVDLKATNNKLRNRSVRIVSEMTGLSKNDSTKLLKKADMKVKTAIVMYFRKVNSADAVEILNECGQSLRKAIDK
ncbi:MAG: N-acetylmuramic acid 6-phosphate etherase [Planctomycetes bacterium GWF2_41_51]|nr:MAG: N-acetylmuramic acid 6-phosphate etherase [Planctomycetes bacterium GWF2_41_51]HBG25786.1 N-acetylmuramic acid 6-phosphate etherase [Phycisphaerales bacterium]